MSILDKYSFQGMPSFRDPTDGEVWVWDASSKTYTKKQKVDEAPRGSQTGGDNNLFDPFEHTQKAGVPELEGHMAGSWNPNGVLCPNCENVTEERECELCGKDLTPEWNKKQDEEGDEAFLHQTQTSPPNEFYSDPEREVKRNRMKTDDSYPSMLGHTQSVSARKGFELAAKIARRTLSQDEWDDFFAGGENTVEIGKWIMGTTGQLYTDQGIGVLHETIAEENGFDAYSPQDVVALGSVYNNQTADTQRVDNPDQFDLESIQTQLQQIFGDVTLQAPAYMSAADSAKGHAFDPFEFTGGAWLIRTRNMILGKAWVKERSNGEDYKSDLILIAEHLQPDDAPLYEGGVAAIITATGSAGSHAALLATQKGYPVVAGIGVENYNKIETGNYLKIDATTKTITVMPGSDPKEMNRSLYDSFKQMDRQENPWYHLEDRFVNKPTFFAHIDEEIAWKLANEPNLEDCPECSAPMSERDGEKFCPDCGHKQPIITTGAVQKEAILPALMLGMGARAMMGSGMLGGVMRSAMTPKNMLMGRGLMSMMPGGEPAIPQVGQPAAPGVPQPPVAPGATMQGLYGHFLYADTFGEDEVGMATKNRGENSDPEHDGSGASFEEKGDSPELQKDVGGGAATSPDEAGQEDAQHGEMEDMALKAFEINLPLILEFAESDNSGADHPIIQAIDNLLEEAFPGYKEIKEDIEEETGLDVDGDGEEGEPQEHVDQVEEASDEFGKEAEEAEEEDDDEEFDKVAMSEMGLVLDASGQIVGQFTQYNPDGTIKVLTRTGYQDMDPRQVRIEKAAALADGNMSMPQGPAATGIPTCPVCQQNHAPGTPCPMQVQQPMAQPAMGMQPMVAPNTQPKVVTHTVEATGPLDSMTIQGWEDQQNAAGEGAPGHLCPECEQSEMVFDDHAWQCQQCGYEQGEFDGNKSDQAIIDRLNAGKSGDFENFDNHSRGYQDVLNEKGKRRWWQGSTVTDDEFMWSKTAELSGWVTEDGRPLEEGADYHLHSEDYAVPDRITVQNVTPEKLTFVIHSGDVDYKDQISKKELETYRYTFKPTDESVDSMSTWEDQEDPIRPGQDAIPQVTDLSTPATKVSTEEPSTLQQDCPECSATTVAEGDNIVCPQCGWKEGQKEAATKESWSLEPDDNPDFDNSGLLITPEDQAAFSNQRQCLDCGGQMVEQEAGLWVCQNCGVADQGNRGPYNDMRPEQMQQQTAPLQGLNDYTGSFDGDAPDSRDWLNEGSGVDVDPVLMEKLAGKDFSAREQREFIDEGGEARNLDKLDLDGTHYILDELESAFNW